jgi:hypothetical protein
MKTIKSIDGKSLLIGGLLVAIMFIGVAAQEAPKKAAQKYEYAWLSLFPLPLQEGEEIKILDNTELNRIVKAGFINKAAKDGWEVDPSGIKERVRDDYYTLMRRPIK